MKNDDGNPDEIDQTDKITKDEEESFPNEEKTVEMEEKPEIIKDEHWRLGGRGALLTLFVLSLGPLVSNIVAAMYGVVDSMWVAKALGTKGMSAISLFTNLDGIGRGFGFLVNCGVTQKISALIGQNRKEEGEQVISDLLRMCFVFGLCVPIIVIPIAKPLAKWFGADEETTEMGFTNITIIMAFSCLSIMFFFACGCLQAEGRTLYVGAMQVTSFILNMFILDPLFLFGFKTSVYGAGLATVLSEGIPAVFIIIQYYRGKFGIKPKWNQLKNKFSPESYAALKVGVSQLFAVLSQSLPGILIRKYLGLASENSGTGNFTQAMAGFNGVLRIFGITNSFRMATITSLLPTASYAYHSGRNRRMFFLIVHTAWMNIIWGILTWLLSFFASREVSSVISSDKDYLDWAAPMLKAANYDALFAWIRFICQAILQALEYSTTATIYSFFATLVVNMLVATGLYYTKKDDVIRLCYTYPITSAIGGIVGVLIVFFPVYKAFKQGDVNKKAAENEEDESEIEAIDSL